MEKIRTRFAPSPTGALHAGTVRTALFAWLVAKHGGGDFILRIEDTDQSRSTKDAEENIFSTLKYVGLDWDEGPTKDGAFGPYHQSQRLDIYKKWGEKLISLGRAYADPYSETELDELRQQSKSNSRPFLFRDHRPESPPKWDGSQPLRFKSNPKDYTWEDLVMGELSAKEEAVDDFILIKSDGFPTYNFAHIIDDHLMHITHVVRSQEFIASVPRFLNLYEALGIQPPKFATVPLVVNESGTKKLSKREGAKHLLEYKEMGILPDAMLSFLATLGWNDGTEQEVYKKEEIISKFDLARVQKGPAHFDEKRLLWVNGHFIRDLDINKLYEMISDYWPDEADSYEESYKKKVLSLVQDRLKYLSELGELTRFFFIDLPINTELIDHNPKLSKYPESEISKFLSVARESLDMSDFSLDDLKKRLNDLLETTQTSPSILFSLIRIATTQSPASPGLVETLEVLGKDVSLRRLKATLDGLSDLSSED